MTAHEEADPFELAEQEITALRADLLALQVEYGRVKEQCAQIAEAQEYYFDTNVGMRQQWVKDQIAAKIRALSSPSSAAEVGEQIQKLAATLHERWHPAGIICDPATCHVFQALRALATT